MIGERVGRLLVVARAQDIYGNRKAYLTRCDCGRTKVVAASSLTRALTQSCGCLQAECAREANTTHAGSHSAEYRVWSGMITRCENSSTHSFGSYGARGIRVCLRWRRSFPAFLKDMGRRPSPAHSIDRIDNARGYEPSNCRWASAREQAQNTRRNVMLTVDGVTKCASEWARYLGVDWRLVFAAIATLRKGGQ